MIDGLIYSADIKIAFGAEIDNIAGDSQLDGGLQWIIGFADLFFQLMIQIKGIAVVAGFDIAVRVLNTGEFAYQAVNQLPHQRRGLFEIHRGHGHQDFAKNLGLYFFIIGDESDGIESLPDKTWDTVDICFQKPFSPQLVISGKPTYQKTAEAASP